MILQSEEPSRIRKKKEIKTDLPLRHLKEMERGEVERGRNRLDLTPAPRAKMNEAQAREGKRRKSAVKTGKPTGHANMEEAASIGMHHHAGFTLKETAKRETHVTSLTGLVESTRPKPTSLLLDSL